MISVPDKWWAQVFTCHSPTYCAFILRISAVFVLSIAHCFWWAQVDSSHSPTYRAFILRISAVFVLSFAHVIGGLKWIRTTDLALIRRTL